MLHAILVALTLAASASSHDPLGTSPDSHTGPHFNEELIPVVVRMAEQGDITAMTDQSREDKMSHLKAAARRSQAQLMAYLATQGSRAADVRSYWIASKVAFRATRDVIKAVESRPDVVYVRYDSLVQVLPPMPIHKRALRVFVWVV
jgi:hypothetical protein